MGERCRIRPRLERLDQGSRPSEAHGARPRLRVRLDQHAYPARVRDAARGLQALGVWQGSVHVWIRGLHAYQARDEQQRGLTRSGFDGGGYRAEEEDMATLAEPIVHGHPVESDLK